MVNHIPALFNSNVKLRAQCLDGIHAHAHNIMGLKWSRCPVFHPVYVMKEITFEGKIHTHTHVPTKKICAHIIIHTQLELSAHVQPIYMCSQWPSAHMLDTQRHILPKHASHSVDSFSVHKVEIAI